MDKRILVFGAVIAIVVMISASVLSSESEADNGDSYQVLIDLGNGETYWSTADNGDNIDDVFTDAFSNQGMTFVSTGSVISVDEKESVTISSGTVSITTTWRYFVWSDDGWIDTPYDGSLTYTGGSIAVGFYPENTSPSATPDNPFVWTMTMGDAENSGNQTNVSDAAAEAAVVNSIGHISVYSSILSAGDHIFFVAGDYPGTNAYLFCLNKATGEEVWKVEIDAQYDMQLAAGAIVGDYVYFPVSYGIYSSESDNYSHIYGVPIAGPGENNEDVLDFKVDTVDHEGMHPSVSTVMAGPSSIVYDSGALYFATSSGYVYCLSLELELLWQTPIQGKVYPSMAVTVHDGLLFVGAYDGYLYMLDSVTGKICDSIEIYFDGKSGGVAVPSVFDDTIIVTYTDGLGMSMATCGTAILDYDSDEKKLDHSTLYKTTQWGRTSNYLVKSETKEFTGVYSTSSEATIVKISTSKTGTIVCDDSTIGEIHGALVLVNNAYFYMSEYNLLGSVFEVDIDGKIVGEFVRPTDIRNYSMTNVTVVDNYTYSTTDSGMCIISGILQYEHPTSSSSGGINTGYIIIAVLIVVLAAFIIYCLHITRSQDVPLVPYLKDKVKTLSGFNNDRLSKTSRNKRRLLIVCLIGVIISFVMFLCCLSFGPSGTLSLPEALSSLISAIQKGGEDLTFNELIVYESRLPRAIAALGVGIGLSVAGCVYQAIIRNPLVDPYIMGVSSGAGTFAVAAIATGFTLFGLLSTDSVFVTPILAIIGGLLAFGLTMLLAEKSGGSSTNYVLAGVIIGMVFSAVQTLILTTSGSEKLNSAISWLFGSFANVGWDTVWLIFIPALFLSLVPLLWAKELNLVLLGEDQAKQMGLNVRKFNRMALILASVLTAVCVAFCGIIGFVGLVVPHLCRMVLGGDHRLVLPASIVIGGALMLFADLMARMIMVPQELPVGAITTIIGVPVFAYLLIKKGRMYDG